MASPLVINPSQIRLAMVGMVEGNGHPYSWSAIVNGQYDAAEMAACGYPVIPQYLGQQPPEALGIDDARVTHIWCDRREDAERVARCTFIDHVVDDPHEVIGKVDGVIIPTDIGHEHVERARPFIDAGLPVFVDKPLTDNEQDLQQFTSWQAQGRPILSTSCMRYAAEFQALHHQMPEVGQPRLITVTMMKSWERYGIHALEAVYHLLPPGGWQSVTHTGTSTRNIIHLEHASEIDVILAVTHDLYGAYGHVIVAGTRGRLDARFADTFSAFKSQLLTFVDYLKTGEAPFDFAQTIEQMKIIIAGIRSREQGGRKVMLSEINA